MNFFFFSVFVGGWSVEIVEVCCSMFTEKKKNLNEINLWT